MFDSIEVMTRASWSDAADDAASKLRLCLHNLVSHTSMPISLGEVIDEEGTFRTFLLCSLRLHLWANQLHERRSVLQ